MKNKSTRHHIIPKSLWWTNHNDNIERKRDIKHRAHHLLYDNKLPHEQIWQIIDLTWKAFDKCFSDDIQSVVNDYDVEAIYNKKCILMWKLKNYILNH